jgi:hypothetical protein
MNRTKADPGKPPGERRRPKSDWRHKVRLAALVQVHSHRNSGDDPSTIRSKVIGAAREALSEAPGDGMIRPIRTPRPDGKGLRDDYRLSGAGMFRLVMAEFDLAWDDPVVAESIMAVVVETLDAELGHES